MKYIFICGFLIIAGCDTKVDVPNAFDLTQGNYKICEVTNTGSTQTEYEFYAPNVSKKISTFDENDCSGFIPNTLDLQYYSYEFNPQTFVLKEVKLGRKIYINTQAEVDLRNAEAYCGLTDWQRNKARNILNTECRGEIFQYNDVKEYQVQITKGSLIIDGVTLLKFN